MSDIDPLIPLLIFVTPLALYVLVRVVSHAWFAGKLDMIKKMTNGGHEDNG